MADTTLVNFRLDQDTKRSMEGVCRDLGMSMTTAFTLFAKKVNRERRIPFDVSLDGAAGARASVPSLAVGANHADPAVIVEGVTRVFGEGAAERRALDGASLTVRRGEFVAVMGASGSGKSTLLHILGGVDAPTAGRVVVDGMDLSTLGPDALALFRRHTVGLVYQAHNLVPFLTARDNIELPLRFDGAGPGPSEVAELLDLLDIADCEQSLPSELSGGQQHRPGARGQARRGACGRTDGQPRPCERRARGAAARQGARPLWDHRRSGNARRERRRRGGPRCAHLGRPRRRGGLSSASLLP